MDCRIRGHNCLSRLQVHRCHSAGLKLRKRKRSVGRIAHIRTQGGEASVERLDNTIDRERAQVLTLMGRATQLLQQRDRDVIEEERVHLV